MRPPRRMAGPRTAAAGTSGIPDSGGVAHGPGRRPLVRGGVMHAPPRRRGADGLRGEALGPRYSPPSRLRRRSAASRDGRPSRSSHAAYFALMRAGSVLPGFPTSEWRDSNPRPRGPQPRALPTAPQSVGRFSRPAGAARPCGSRVTEKHVRPVACMRCLHRIPSSPRPDSNRQPPSNGLFPLSYRGVCRLVAGASQLVSRFDGIHIGFSPVAMALRLPRLSPTGMMVFNARSTRMF